MKQYRPDVERQKWLYSMEKSRKVLRRWQGKPDGPAPSKPGIPDNSEPWLPGGVRSVADALWISYRIKEDMERWRPRLNPAKDQLHAPQSMRSWSFATSPSAERPSAPWP